MKRLIIAAVLCVAALVPTVALAKAPTARHRGVYFYLRRHVEHKFGVRAMGRNIVKDGRSDKQAVTDAGLTDSIGVYERMLHPPPPPAPAGSSVSPAAVMSTSSSPVWAAGDPTGAAGVPACASESGSNYSTDPSNTNGSSGATGRYQIIPSTHAAVCGDLGWSPADQDTCAQRIFRAQGAGAWVGCGG
jgi:hypothetical protein